MIAHGIHDIADDIREATLSVRHEPTSHRETLAAHTHGREYLLLEALEN